MTPRQDRMTTAEARIREDTHARLSGHTRECGTLSATVHRALDALDRERRYPTPVIDSLDADHGAPTHACPHCDAAYDSERALTRHRTDAHDDSTAIKHVSLTHSARDRLHAEAFDGENLSSALDRALDALDREARVPDAVNAVVEG